MKDRPGVIWMATENGLSNISKKASKFNNLFSEQKGIAELEELKKKNIKAINQHNDGSIFFGTSDGVYYLNGSSYDRKLRRFSNTEGLNVWSMVSGSSDDLWIGTYGQGLKQLNLKDGRLKNITIKSSTFGTSAYDFIKSLCLEKNILWIGFWGGGLAKYDTETGNYKIWITEAANPNSISYNDLWSIIRDRKGRLWLGTNGGGLNLFDNLYDTKFYRLTENIKNSIKLSGNSIYFLCEGKRGKYSDESEQTILWVGTSRGLNKLVINSSPDIFKVDASNTNVISYLIKNGLADNSIKSILEDENGNLWLATNAGISFFDVEREYFINFTESDGLRGHDFNSESALYSDEGLMYFGSTEGLNVFDPKQIQQSSYIPSIVLTEFQIFNQPVKIGGDSPLKENILEAKEIILPYSDNVFSFQFAALDFNSSQSIQYAYMMEGFDEDWILAGN